MRTDRSGEFYWLIERKADPPYLGVSDRFREFAWIADAAAALGFATEQQADSAMLAIRQLVPALFPVHVHARPVEHGWPPRRAPAPGVAR